MLQTDEEKEQNKQIGILKKIFLPILTLTVIGAYFKSNSTEYIERHYLEFHNYSFSGIVYKKTQDQRGEGCNIARYLHLKTGIIHRVNCYIYPEIEIGDYVFKKSKSDTVFYIKKNCDTIKQNENSYYDDYNKLLKK